MNEWAHWFSAQGHDWIQSVGIVGGLVFTALALRADTKSRRAENLIRITENHRDLWTRFDAVPTLRRVLDPHPDLDAQPITHEEARFVQFMILHLHTTFHLARSGLYQQPKSIKDDVRSLLTFPVPRNVWGALKAFQDQEFVEFVESALRTETQSGDSPHSKGD
jgi:hypothetical protein